MKQVDGPLQVNGLSNVDGSFDNENSPEEKRTIFWQKLDWLSIVFYLSISKSSFFLNST